MDLERLKNLQLDCAKRAIQEDRFEKVFNLPKAKEALEKLLSLHSNPQSLIDYLNERRFILLLELPGPPVGFIIELCTSQGHAYGTGLSKGP